MPDELTNLAAAVKTVQSNNHGYRSWRSPKRLFVRWQLIASAPWSSSSTQLLVRQSPADPPTDRRSRTCGPAAFHPMTSSQRCNPTRLAVLNNAQITSVVIKNKAPAAHGPDDFPAAHSLGWNRRHPQRLRAVILQSPKINEFSERAMPLGVAEALTAEGLTASHRRCKRSSRRACVSSKELLKLGVEFGRERSRPAPTKSLFSMARGFFLVSFCSDCLGGS